MELDRHPSPLALTAFWDSTARRGALPRARPAGGRPGQLGDRRSLRARPDDLRLGADERGRRGRRRRRGGDAPLDGAAGGVRPFARRRAHDLGRAHRLRADAGPLALGAGLRASRRELLRQPRLSAPRRAGAERGAAGPLGRRPGAARPLRRREAAPLRRARRAHRSAGGLRARPDALADALSAPGALGRRGGGDAVDLPAVRGATATLRRLRAWPAAMADGGRAAGAGYRGAMGAAPLAPEREPAARRRARRRAPLRSEPDRAGSRHPRPRLARRGRRVDAAHRSARVRARALRALGDMVGGGRAAALLRLGTGRGALSLPQPARRAELAHRAAAGVVGAARRLRRRRRGGHLDVDGGHRRRGARRGDRAARRRRRRLGSSSRWTIPSCSRRSRVAGCTGSRSAPAAKGRAACASTRRPNAASRPASSSAGGRDGAFGAPRPRRGHRGGVLALSTARSEPARPWGASPTRDRTRSAEALSFRRGSRGSSSSIGRGRTRRGGRRCRGRPPSPTAAPRRRCLHRCGGRAGRAR